MIKFLAPEKAALLARIPLFIRIQPLKRPKANWHSRGNIYQPLDNQRELFAALKDYAPLGIEQPVILEIFINIAKPNIGPAAMKKLPTWPTRRKEGDLDNLEKAVNDALVKAGIIADDSYVIGMKVFKSWAEESVCLVNIWSVQETPVVIQ